MPADLLLVTASNSFADSIRRTMEESNLYRVHVVNNKAAAIVRADEAGIPLAMIDLGLGEEWVQEIGKSLRTIRPGINLIIVCDDNQTPPAFDSLRPWVLVRKSFDMTDFMDALNRPQTDSVTNTTPLAWLSDETKAAQHLTRLTLESSAQAALITRNNEMWAYAGGLSQEAAKEVAHTVSRNWDGQKGSDLLRFIRLESTKAEHMLYATRLGADVMLALVFDAETPFSTIRSQAGQLVTGLGNKTDESQKFTPPPVKQQPAAVEFEETEFGGEDDGVQISDILKSVPSPNPDPSASKKKDRDSGVNWPRKPEKKFDSNETRVSMPLSNATVFSRDPATQPLGNPVMMDQSQGMDLSSETEFKFDQLEVTAPSRPKARPETPIARPANDTDMTRESPTTEASKKLTMEPVSAGLYHLTYACLLVPRFSSHHLVGDISEALNEWLPNISVAFGWRLEFLAIRPEYLQWVANVQPNTSPGYLMRIMRLQTSEKLFSNFPQYKKENPSGDFWAPGYLIMGGTQPHPPQLVRDYIRQIRTRQGSEAPPRPDKPGK
jgi:REP element-mobilizing transposase RayT